MNYPAALGMWPHLVDVILIEDASTTPRGFKSQPRYLVRSAVKCRVLEFPASRSDLLAHKDIFGREEGLHPYLVNLPDPIVLTTAHQLVWVRPVDDAVLYLQVKAFERSPDEHAWLPAAAYCETNEAAVPPIVGASGLTPYTPPSGG